MFLSVHDLIQGFEGVDQIVTILQDVFLVLVQRTDWKLNVAAIDHFLVELEQRVSVRLVNVFLYLCISRLVVCINCSVTLEGCLSRIASS